MALPRHCRRPGSRDRRQDAPVARGRRCASLGGALFGVYTLSGYGLHAQGLELDAIAGAVIDGALLTGGVGYVMGTLTGVLMLGVIQTLIMFDGSLSSWWTRIAIGALLGLFCVLQRALELVHRFRRAPAQEHTRAAA